MISTSPEADYETVRRRRVMKMKWGIIAGVLGGIAAAEAGGSAYFYRRTMMRYNAKKERTMKMSGVDWEELLQLYEATRRVDESTGS